MSIRRYFRRHVALPADHGTWVFLLSPMLIGLFAGGRLSVVTAYYVIAALSAFFVRQPVTLAVKMLSGRRSRDDLDIACFWIAVYSALGLLHVLGLVLRGYGYLLYLALPSVPVLAWYLYLVSRRAERRQMLVEFAATAVLALSAPAGLWIGLGRPDPAGWLLWGLSWLQSAASIVYVYLRLEQRNLPEAPGPRGRLRMAAPSLLLATANLALVIALSLSEIVPPWLFAAYVPQLIETLQGSLRPALGAAPVAIGLRQLAVSTAFTALFILAWCLPAPAG